MIPVCYELFKNIKSANSLIANNNIRRVILEIKTDFDRYFEYVLGKRTKY